MKSGCPAIAIIHSHFLYEAKFISMPIGFQCPAREDCTELLREILLGLGTRQEFISLLINWQLLPSSSARLRSGCSPFDWLHVSVLREINCEADQRPRVRDDQFYDALCTMALLSPYCQKKENRITSNRRASLQARVNSVT